MSTRWIRLSLPLAFSAALLGGRGAAALAGEGCPGVPGVADACLGAPLHSAVLANVSGAGLDQAPLQPAGLRVAAVILWDESGKPRVQHAGNGARWTSTALGVRVELSTAP